jgi:inosine/xanthosine triphosphatase
MVKVLVASTSQHKLGAVERVFKETYSDWEIDMEGVKAPSEINEQPVGHKEMIEGALNRIKNAKKTAKGKKFDFVVGIENGIFPIEVDGTEKWFDVAWVVIENKEDKQSLAVSAGVEFPREFIQEARKKGFKTTTVGSIIAEKTGCDGTDPHTFLTSNLASRSKLLEQALKIALGQLQERAS